jgi:hypothetical protein
MRVGAAELECKDTTLKIQSFLKRFKEIENENKEHPRTKQI